jgi:tRNA(Ile)-lysidine synthase
MRCANAPPLNANGPIVGRDAPALTAAQLSDKLRSLHAAETYALAVSGGRDSMGLLQIAAATAKLPNAPRFIVLSVDHGLRREAREEVQMVAAQCADLGLEHHILTADARLGDSDIQQQARNMRYRLMAAHCRPLRAPLVTAHHLHDQAETVAMRLARGSGVDGLAGMAAAQWLETPAGRLLVLRPCLDLPPAALHGDLPYTEDPSNADTGFERVRWRHHMPTMREAGLSPEALAALARDMRDLRMQRDAALYDWLETHAEWHDYGVLIVPRDGFLALAEPLQARLLSACVRLFGRHAHPPKRAAIAGFGDQLRDVENGAAVLGGVLTRWRQKKIFLGREYAALKPKTDKPRPAPCEGLQWDARFDFITKADGHFVAPLGPDGVAALRAQGMVFDTTVPAAYHTVLPALFETKKSGCAVRVGLATENNLRCVSSEHLFAALLERGQDW